MVPADVEERSLSATRLNVPAVESAEEAPLMDTPVELVSRRKAEPKAVAIRVEALVKKRELVLAPTEPAVELTVNDVVPTEAAELLVMLSWAVSVVLVAVMAPASDSPMLVEVSNTSWAPMVPAD